MTRTTLNLDRELVDRARRELGTTTTTDTIHEALREAIDRRAIDRVLAHDFSLLDEAQIDRLRTPDAGE